jgi:hypothetical protein
MLNSEIYESALRILGESLNEGENEDYKESAAFLIAAFCNETEDVDDSIRRICGLSEKPYFNPVWVSLDEEFPSSERLAPAASLYLAAMLILDDDPERSESLYEKYCDSISTIENSLPMMSERIVDLYGY